MGAARDSSEPGGQQPGPTSTTPSMSIPRSTAARDAARPMSSRGAKPTSSSYAEPHRLRPVPTTPTMPHSRRLPVAGLIVAGSWFASRSGRAGRPAGSAAGSSQRRHPRVVVGVADGRLGHLLPASTTPPSGGPESVTITSSYNLNVGRTRLSAAFAAAAALALVVISRKVSAARSAIRSRPLCPVGRLRTLHYLIPAARTGTGPAEVRRLVRLRDQVKAQGWLPREPVTRLQVAGDAGARVIGDMRLWRAGPVH